MPPAKSSTWNRHLSPQFTAGLSSIIRHTESILIDLPYRSFPPFLLSCFERQTCFAVAAELQINPESAEKKSLIAGTNSFIKIKTVTPKFKFRTSET